MLCLERQTSPLLIAIYVEDKTTYLRKGLTEKLVLTLLRTTRTGARSDRGGSRCGGSDVTIIYISIRS